MINNWLLCMLITWMVQSTIDRLMNLVMHYYYWHPFSQSCWLLLEYKEFLFWLTLLLSYSLSYLIAKLALIWYAVTAFRNVEYSCLRMCAMRSRILPLFKRKYWLGEIIINGGWLIFNACLLVCIGVFSICILPSSSSSFLIIN